MGYSSQFSPGPVKDWFESTADVNAQRCLRAGAAHELLKHAGFKKCWRCYVTIADGHVTWDDARILHAIIPCPMTADTAWLHNGLADIQTYNATLPRPLHVINAVESGE